MQNNILNFSSMSIRSFCLFGVLHLRIFTDSSTLNLARNASARYFTEVVTVWMDGNTNFMESQPYNSYPDKTHGTISINFKEQCSIHFVVIYAGNNVIKHQLDFLEIMFIERPTGTSRCSEYPAEVKSGDVITINCEPSLKLQDEVQINSQHNLGFDIAEIEMHTFATEFPQLKHALLYRGCFKVFGGTGFSANFIICQERCVSGGHTFMGMKLGEYCSCADVMDNEHELPVDNCGLKCPAFPNRFCGTRTNEYYSVYLIKPPLPYFFGCFTYNDEGFKIGNAYLENNMTVIRCIIHCDDFKYAKLERGRVCICDNDRPKLTLKQETKRCNVRCDGDKWVNCGAHGLVSVYSTCNQVKRGSLPCSSVFQCHGRYSYLGECDACKQGHVGKYCLEFADFTATPFPITPSFTNSSMTPSASSKGLGLVKILLLVTAAIGICYPAIMQLCKKKEPKESGGSSAASAQIPLPSLTESAHASVTQEEQPG